MKLGTSESGGSIRVNRMTPKFTISKFGKIYCGVFLIVYLICFLVISEKTPYQTGKFVGSMFGFLFMPSLFAWVVWKLSKHNEKYSNAVFQLIVTCMIIGFSMELSREGQYQIKYMEFEEKGDSLRNEIASMDDLGELEGAYDRYTEYLLSGIGGLAETSTGFEKKALKILSEFMDGWQNRNREWKDSYNAVLAHRILDYAVLNSDEEFDYQRKILAVYVKETESYRNYYHGILKELKKRLSISGKDDEFARGIMKGATRKYNSQKTVLEPLLQAHIDFGRGMIQLLALLQKHKDQWALENNELLIYNDKLVDEYDRVIDALEKNHETIDDLSDRCRELL